MNVDSQVSLHSLKVDGGMTMNKLLMQFQADILDAQVRFFFVVTFLLKAVIARKNMSAFDAAKLLYENMPQL